MSAAEGPRLLTKPLVLNSHTTQVEVPAQKLAMGPLRGIAAICPVNKTLHTPFLSYEPHNMTARLYIMQCTVPVLFEIFVGAWFLLQKTKPS